VSKAIDKRRDDEPAVREVCRFLRASIEDSSWTVKTLAAHFGFHPRMVEHWAARDTDSQPTLPTLEQWDQLRDLLEFADDHDAEVLRLNLRKGEPGEAWADRPVTGQVEEWKDRANYALTSRDGLRRDVATTPEAQKWQGWGTALKPAHEPIVVARKPLSGTVAQNVQEHGTGAVNVDGCRVGVDADDPGRKNWHQNRDDPGEYPVGESVYELGLGPVSTQQNPSGRWPANVVLDEEAAGVLDEQTGNVRSAGDYAKGAGTQGDKAGAASIPIDGLTSATYADSGGASRFFYCAKADRAERGPENRHPTVKPVALMRWLVRLVTPPEGLVLDPFTGSGTTGIAALSEGFSFLGIERESEYAELARQRIRDDAPLLNVPAEAA
jgi:hypothetical protein